MSMSTHGRYSIESPYELIFYPSDNRFRDEDNNVIHSLHDFFSVYELERWKKTKQYACMKAKTGDMVEFWYLDPDVEDYLLNYSHLWSDDDYLLYEHLLEKENKNHE